MTTATITRPKTNQGPAEWVVCARCGSKRLKKNTRDGFCHRPTGNCYWDNERDERNKADMARREAEKAERLKIILEAMRTLFVQFKCTKKLADGREAYWSDETGTRALVSADGSKTSLHLVDISPDEVQAIAAILSGENMNEHKAAIIDETMSTAHVTAEDVEAIQLILNNDVDADLVKAVQHCPWDAAALKELADIKLETSDIVALQDAARLLNSIQDPTLDDILITAGHSNQQMRLISWKVQDAMQLIHGRCR